MNIKSSLSLFLTVVFLAFAIFTAFVPYEWICVLLNTKKCNIHHGVVIIVSLLLFLLAIIASKEFDLKTTFLESGK